MSVYETIEFRFLSWAADDGKENARWHCYKFMVDDHDGSMENVFLSIWDKAEEKFKLFLDFGADGTKAYFRIEHLDEDWVKGERVVAYFKNALEKAGYKPGLITKEIDEG
jgi:hypothetical protein